jgi:tRNA(Ile)-lysidine synthase
VSPGLPEAFRERLNRLRPDWPARRFLVAFSGGLDSTALLHLMAGLLPPEQLAAAHLNHQLRGQAAADLDFAEKAARRLNIAFFSESRDVRALARERGRGLEEAARRARYDFLSRAAGLWGADLLLTAHQADDQVETILMNFLKGSGPGGLAGIPPRRPLARGGPGPELLRPLLSFSRAELRQWLTGREIAWVEDLSNQDRRYRRNALRLELRPILERFNPGLGAALRRGAEILRGEEDFWREHLARLWPDAVLRAGPGNISLDRGKLRRLSLAERRRLIHEALSLIWRQRPRAREPLTFESVETVLEMLERPGHRGLDLPGGLRAELGPEELRLSPASRFREG